MQRRFEYDAELLHGMDYVCGLHFVLGKARRLVRVLRMLPKPLPSSIIAPSMKGPMASNADSPDWAVKYSRKCYECFVYRFEICELHLHSAVNTSAVRNGPSQISTLFE